MDSEARKLEFAAALVERYAPLNQLNAFAPEVYQKRIISGLNRYIRDYSNWSTAEYVDWAEQQVYAMFHYRTILPTGELDSSEAAMLAEIKGFLYGLGYGRNFDTARYYKIKSLAQNLLDKYASNVDVKIINFQREYLTYLITKMHDRGDSSPETITELVMDITALLRAPEQAEDIKQEITQ